ncbi:MAG: hypothetical protein WD875_13005 [Pirellulales bacterium]
MPSDGARSGGNRPQRGDWRGGGRSARPSPGAKAAAGKEGHDWARRKTDDSTKLLWIFRGKIAFGVLLVIGLFVAIVLMLPRPTTTPFISLVISEYSYPVPPNAWAYDDVENIRRLLARDGENRTGGEPLAVSSERQIIWKADKEEWLGNLSREVEKAATIKWWQTLGRGPGDGAVIIYLSGLGVVDDEGRACLLLPGLSESDSVFDAARRMPVSELLDSLFYDRAGKQERLPRDVLKLVILDAGRIDQEWELGLPYNAFVESLRGVVESELPVSNLFVLNSADAGEKAWASPELGGTVFGHFVRRGLQGHADGYAEGSTVRDPDRFVTVEELYEYVRRQTTRFVATYRGDEQRPVLLAAAGTKGDARDRRLVEYGATLLDAEKPDSEEVSAARRERLTQISARWEKIRRAGWDRYAKLADRGIRYHPLAWQRFEHMLLRLERLAVAGGAKTYQVQFEAGIEELSETIARIESSAPSGAPPNGIALARALSPNPDAADTKATDSAAMDAVVAAFGQGKDDVEGLAQRDYFFRSQAAWRWIEQTPSNAEWDKLAERIDRLNDQILPTSGNWRIEDEPIEVHFVRMLAAFRNRRETPDPKLLFASIARRAAAENVAAPTDVRVHYNTRRAVMLADENRRQTEDSLFVGRASDLAKAKESGGTADAQYQRADELAKALSDAYALRDRSLAEIPWLVRYRARRLEAGAASNVDDQAMYDLLDLHHDVQQLIRGFVDRPRVGGLYERADVDTFVKRTNDLRGEFEKLRKPILEAMNKRSAQGSASDRLRLLDALALPLLVGEDRENLHKQARVLFGDKFSYTDLAPDSTEDATVAEGRTDHHVARMLKWRRHPAMDLVDAPMADIKPGERASLADAGRALRQRLVELERRIAAAKGVPGDLSLDDGLTIPTLRAELAQTDLESRAAGLFRGPLPKITPAERLERFDRQRLLVWHYQRTLEDFWGPSPQKLDQEFFHVAAQRAAALARSQDDGIDARSPNAATQTAEMSELLAGRVKAASDGLGPRFDDDQLRINFDPKDQRKQSAIHLVTIDRKPGADLPLGTAAYYLAEATDAAAAAATESARLAAISGKQVDTTDTRLAYEIAANRSGEPRQPLKYTINDLYAQSQRTSLLRGIVLYRGHRYRHSSEIVRLSPRGCEREYELRPPTYDPPTVTIKGKEKRRAVLLVLDCSASMVEKGAGSRTRMEIAREAVNKAVAELRAGSRDAKIGLWLYGHRTRYKSDDNPSGEVVPKENLSPADAATRPAADVEQRIALATLTDDVEKKIKDALVDVAPHGYTPLYYAIHEALATGFSTLENPKDYERQILVLTDGGNVQCIKDDKIPVGGNPVVVSDKMLRSALVAQRDNAIASGVEPVRLDVIGYDFVDENLAKFAAYRGTWNFGNRTELAAAIDGLGDIHDVKSDPELSTERKLELLIQSLLGIHRFTIVNAETGAPVTPKVDGRPRSGFLRLNEVLKLEGPAGGFKVKFEEGLISKNDRNAIRGGDVPPADFDFTLANRGEQLLFRIYENHTAGTYDRWLQQEDTHTGYLPFRVGDRENGGDNFVDGNSGKKIRLKPLLPTWKPTPRGWEFHVTVSYDPGKNNHTPQPVEALAVIQPRKNDVNPITIYDVKFEPGASVPEISFVVPEWRDKAGAADQAYLWVWFNFTQQAPSLTEFYAGATAIEPVVIDGKPIRFTVDPSYDQQRRTYVVKVSERHAGDEGTRPATMDRIKVSMDSKEAPPSRIHRCYVTGGREIVHTFEYPEGTFKNLDELRRRKVVITRIEDIKRNSVVRINDLEKEGMLIDVPIDR